MAIQANFDKSKVEYLLGCIEGGKPIKPMDSEGEWTQNDLLALAGACFFAVMSHGPALLPQEEKAKLPAEYQEAYDDTLYSDIHLAIEWFADATMLVKDGEYDREYEPHHKALLYGEKKVAPIKGFRGRKN